jgi:hypothetical protein
LFPTGFKPSSATQSQWDFWFDINVDPTGANGTTLTSSGLDFYFTVLAPGALTPTTPFNLLSLNDNSYGNNSTANGAGVIAADHNTGHAGSVTLQGANNIAQNAENLSFGFLPGFNPDQTGDYQFEVFAVASGADPLTAARVGEVDGTVDVVPEPATLALGGLGALALLGVNRFRRKA